MSHKQRVVCSNPTKAIKMELDLVRKRREHNSVIRFANFLKIFGIS